jgi:hypothetical protein
MRCDSIGRYSASSSPSEVESPMWTMALQLDLVESSACALVSGGGFVVPSAFACSTQAF